MSARGPTYRDRVQGVLSEAAKGMKDSVIYDVLVERIHFSMFRDDIRYGPRSRDFIQDAISAEVRARRVSLTHQGLECKISLTSDGKRFYQAMGGSVILTADDKRLTRLTVTQLHEQAELMRRVVREIKYLFVHYHRQGTDSDNFDIPHAIKQLFRRIDGLNQEWTDLQAELAASQAAARNAGRHTPPAIVGSSPLAGNNSPRESSSFSKEPHA